MGNRRAGVLVGMLTMVSAVPPRAWAEANHPPEVEAFDPDPPTLYPQGEEPGRGGGGGDGPHLQGPGTVPGFSRHTYRAVNTTATAFTWTVTPPSAATLLGGQGTPSLTLLWAGGPVAATLSATAPGVTPPPRPIQIVRVDVGEGLPSFEGTGEQVAAQIYFTRLGFELHPLPTIQFRAPVEVSGVALDRLRVRLDQVVGSVPLYRGFYGDGIVLRGGVEGGGPWYDGPQGLLMGTLVTFEWVPSAESPRVTLQSQDSPQLPIPIMSDLEAPALSSGAQLTAFSATVHFTLDLTIETQDAPAVHTTRARALWTWSVRAGVGGTFPNLQLTTLPGHGLDRPSAWTPISNGFVPATVLPPLFNDVPATFFTLAPEAPDIWLARAPRLASGVNLTSEEDSQWLPAGEGKLYDGVYRQGGVPYSGLKVFLYPTGEKKLAGRYEKGARQDRWTAWYRDGTVRAEGVYQGGLDIFEGRGRKRMVVPGERSDGHDQDFANGKSGLWRTWHPNGQLASEEWYTDGTLTGLVQRWDAQGRPLPEAYHDAKGHPLPRGALGMALAPAKGGLKVTSVRPTTPAAQAGLRAGDMLVRLEGLAVPPSAHALYERLLQFTPRSRVKLTGTRRGQPATWWLQTPD